MTIRRFLLYFTGIKSERFSVPRGTAEPSVFCSPGMHQIMEEPEEIAFTREDQEFLRQMGVCATSKEGQRVIDATFAEEERRQSPLRA
jgi:hypothetical protein